MCRSCQSWESVARQAWNEVFRLADILRSSGQALPQEARGAIDGMVRIISSPTPVEVGSRIRFLAQRCENQLSGQDRSNLVAERSDIIQGAAQRIKSTESAVAAIRQYNSFMTTASDAQVNAGLRYLDMANSVMQDFVVMLSRNQEAWDNLWAEHRAVQARINQMQIDALTGTPFIKQYIA
jgi:hypothetical protein